MSTAADIRPGTWVRTRHHDQWWYVHDARHTPLREDEPRSTGYVQFDASEWPHGGRTLGGYADHRDQALVVTVTPEASS